MVSATVAAAALSTAVTTAQAVPRGSSAQT